MFLYIVPLKQGLKQLESIFYQFQELVFIHSSIKTRIETMEKNRDNPNFKLFLYIVPLKQGLKLKFQNYILITDIPFLYIVPLKQGLKPKQTKRLRERRKVFIHSSIKTRIETRGQYRPEIAGMLFLYIVPLKQGLKQRDWTIPPSMVARFLYIVPLKQGLKHKYGY